MTPAMLHWLIVANLVAVTVNALSVAHNIRAFLRSRRQTRRILADLRAMEAQLRGELTKQEIMKIMLGDETDDVGG